MLAGDNFNDQILNKLQEADIVLLLISPDFLASDFCTRIEAARALERHRLGECRSIAVILRPCDWQETDLSTYLAIPTDGKPVSLWPNQDEALQNIVEAVREVLKVSVPISAEERTPFSAKNSALKPESGKESPTASNWPGYLDRVEEKFS
jgi:hypothetical protein